MNFEDILEKLISALSKYKSILIYIKGSPDPDVIASSFALALICEKIKIKSRITCPIKPSLPQNSAIIDDLNIPVHFEESLEHTENYDAYAILDFQSAILDGITRKIPCVLHIDHHDKIEEDIMIDFKLVLEEAGSVSTFFAIIIKLFVEKHQGFDLPLLRRVSTALVYGIHVDTDALKHAGQMDFDALNYLSNYSDKRILEHVMDIPLPKDVILLISKALKNREEYKNCIFTGIGIIDELNRDSIAIIADFLLQKFKSSWVVVFAAIDKKKPPGLRLDASFRTENEHIDLNRLIKLISTSGGGRKYKGAYQVDLNYFAGCPDKELLWEVIRCTTIAKLKELRDKMQFIEIKGFYNKIRNKTGKFILKK